MITLTEHVSQQEDEEDDDEDGLEGGAGAGGPADAYSGMLAAGVHPQAAAYAADTRSAGAAAGRSFALAWALVLARVLGAEREGALRLARALGGADECAPRPPP